MSRLLLLSNSTMPGTPFFTWPGKFVQEFLGSKRLNGVFIPFAAVTLSFDDYGTLVQKTFKNLGHDVTSIHSKSDPVRAVNEAEVIIVGGGNSFALLNRMYQYNLVELIRNKILGGIPYIGWSAGANLACPTIMTTNDMPIVYPPSFDALNLIPLQINPHYTEFKQTGHGGETRQQRIEEFLVLNGTKKVVGLREGTLLHREEDSLILKGVGEAKLFQANVGLENLIAPTNLSHLLRT